MEVWHGHGGTAWSWRRHPPDCGKCGTPTHQTILGKSLMLKHHEHLSSIHTTPISTDSVREPLQYIIKRVGGCLKTTHITQGQPETIPQIITPHPSFICLPHSTSEGDGWQNKSIFFLNIHFQYISNPLRLTTKHSLGPCN